MKTLFLVLILIAVPLSAMANGPPVAVADYYPKDTSFKKGNSMEVVLDGSESFDHDGDDLTYTWNSIEGDYVGQGETMALTLRPGSYGFVLTVFDGQIADMDFVEFSVAKRKGNK